MVVSGEMDGSPVVEVESLGEEDRERLVEDGKQVTPNIRRSERRISSKAPFARGRLRKSGPKSPMMRMAELRRSGLRVKDLRLTGGKGTEEMGQKSGKGKKGSSGRKMVLPSISEGSEGDAGLVEKGNVPGDENHGGADVLLVQGDEEMGVLISADKVNDVLSEKGFEAGTVALELRGGEEGCKREDVLEVLDQIGSDKEFLMLEDGSGQGVKGVGMEGINDGVLSDWEEASEQEVSESTVAMAEIDLALDLCEAQPLQNMEFLTPSNGVGCSKWAELAGVNVSEKTDGKLEEEFPPLSKNLLNSGKNLNSGSVEQRGINDAKMGGVGVGATGGKNRSFANESRGKQGGEVRRSMADVIKAGESDPIFFEPDKIRRIGITGERAGLPAIHFSGSDTSFLAEKLGHVVVGKFSHSIPSAHHIQKALQGMKLVGEYSWSYINAKHILIQFKLIADYAKLLNGPNGRPVWFIERHPMRVFKWTPDFDPFFESPIAAIWCNLVGLPIHLFEKSALFAIGGLLGTPIQVDHATISQKRLSFARICVEIDISKTPPNEIVIDMQGREIHQRVKWDRIPQYCQDCRHVGHTMEKCYANGNKEKPTKKDYSTPYPKWQHPEAAGVEEGGAQNNGDQGKEKQDVRRAEKVVPLVGKSDKGPDVRLGEGGLSSVMLSQLKGLEDLWKLMGKVFKPIGAEGEEQRGLEAGGWEDLFLLTEVEEREVGIKGGLVRVWRVIWKGPMVT